MLETIGRAENPAGVEFGPELTGAGGALLGTYRGAESDRALDVHRRAARAQGAAHVEATTPPRAVQRADHRSAVEARTSGVIVIATEA